MEAEQTANDYGAGRGREERKDPDSDQELVERAQRGDTEAFGELIEQHRGKARGWAQRMTGDPHMADDIVQDALIRAFLHLGSLADTSRFLPWLHRIVRNQANMRLRRGGPHRKERPFASMGAAGSDGSKVDWEDLDSILHHLARTASEVAGREQDPAEHWLRKETYETIHALLHCLTAKERAIFRAYFFRQLKPEEIASMYRMATGSVYTYLHRSRQKLRKEHIRVSLGLLPDRGGSGLVKSKILRPADWPEPYAVRTTFVDSIGRMLAFIGDRRDVAELMGVSGFAFRMKISDMTTFADGIYIFDWRQALQTFMEELGYHVTMLCGQLATSLPLLGAVERFPIVLPIEESVLPFIRKYIDLGKPALYFDTTASRPYVHEWSVIYGYDDEQRLVYLTDPMVPGGKTLSYDDVVENPIRFIAGIDGVLSQENARLAKEQEEERRRQAVRAVRFAVRYARNGCDYSPMTAYLRYTSGLGAYSRWAGHLRSGHTVPNRYGMGQLSAVYAETRRYASLYLRSIPFEGEAMRLTLLASDAYEQAAEAMETLSSSVPFIRTSELMEQDIREACVECLEQAREFETAAIGYLEKAMTFINEPKGMEQR